ncbi:RNA polymerase sigma factor [Urbifossiella limnaea]|uniref:ECF RNA polymerase sigma factor SigE n=1 Tax=Urbifossiella limnaea TaxID=2528023 RepID=A0A517Y274_9BACT|nr:sigma-70 family RNA polymerase sigma factor [Urbifossiella limnaea]QDU23798.1 ECF RNA polymerase sigma factor SigE [Urbifossiella limnaea]
MTPLAALFRRSAADPRADGPLLAAFVHHRDEPAFAELVRRHGPLVWGACRRALPDPADAEDAFQATFLVLVRRARALTAAGTVGPWLLKVAALTARNARRKNARRLARAAPLPDLPDPRPVPADVDDVLLGLPERCRAAVLLTHLEGLTHREAADRLGCAEGTVSSLVSRGLSRLRARLGVEVALGVAVPAGLADAAVRSATADQLASASASSLAREVLRMFWVRKATAAGFATLVVLAAGFGAGMAVREAPAAGQDKEKAAVAKGDALGGPKAPYIVLTIRGLPQAGASRGVLEPFTITEFDERGKCLWSVIPGRDQAEKWSTTVKLIELDQEAIIGGARAYLTRVRKDATAPRDLRVVIENDAQVGGFTLEGFKVCRDAGFDTIRLTGYLPSGGGFIPMLKVGPNGEAEGYKRYRGELVETKKLLADYAQMLRTL